jgi:hypothetical protein
MKSLPKYCIFLFAFWLIDATSLYAQNTERLMKAANTLYQNYNYDRAIELYKDVLIEDNSAEAKKRLAECYRMLGNLAQSEYWYKKLIEQQPEIAENKLVYAQVLQINGKCAEAKKWYLEYAKYDIWGEKLAQGCDKVAQWSRNPNKYQTFFVPFNSPAADFGITNVGDRLIYCSNRTQVAGEVSSSAKDNGFLDIFWVDRQPNFLFDVPKRIKGKVNSEYNDGPASFSITDSTLYFSRNSSATGGKKIKSSDGKIRLSIFSARLQADGRFSNLKPFEHNNTEYTVSHPAISTDGQTLYFASDMPGGMGGLDLYFCTRIDSLWSRPINLGPVVNSPGNEMFPFVDNSGKLYYSSNGLPGLGGYDIFSTQRRNNQWTNPDNMGQPINANFDDFSFWISDNRQYGFFSSNRPGGMGNDDIYRFNVEGYFEEVKIDTTLIVDTLTTVSETPAMFILDKPEIDNPILNTKLGINKIAFKAGDWTLTAEAQTELDKVVGFLRLNPAVTVELGSHTDSRGDDFFNYETSIKRADAAREYIFLQGLPATQVQSKGYGENEVLNGCYNNIPCTNDQHEQNNRLNVKVIALRGAPVKATLPPPYETLPDVTIKPEPIVKVDTVLIDSTGVAMLTVDTIKTINPIDTLPKMQFRVNIGPYKTIDNNVYYSYAEIGTPINQKETEKGTFIQLGPYPTIAEAEMYQSYAEKIGGKIKIVGYLLPDDVESPLNSKKLKKIGYK